MALHERHRYILRKLDENFGILDEAATEDLIKSAPILDAINRFFRGDGSRALMFFYTWTSPLASAESGYQNDHGRGGHTITVSDGSNLPLAERAVFFVKTAAGGQSATIDPMKEKDSSLSFGVINSPLESFEGMVRRLYQPMLGSQSVKEWGKADGEHANEFMISLDSLVQNLQEVRNGHPRGAA